MTTREHARRGMEESYTAYWANDLCRELERNGTAGTPLAILFGGPHQSEPSFRRAGVKEGDYIYPVRVLDGALYLLVRMRVKQLIVCTSGAEGGAALDHYLELYPRWRCLARTCTDEVIVGDEGLALRFDLAVPPELLERLTFRSRRGERRLKHIENGRLVHALGVQGIYRLSPRSAAELAALLPR